MNNNTDRDLSSSCQLYSISYRDILEKFCKVLGLEMRIIDVLREEGYSSLVPTYIVKTYKIHDAEKSKYPIWFTNKGHRYNISTSGLTIEDACKKYIEDFLLDEQKNIRFYIPAVEDSSFPHDRLESANLNFPRSGLEALMMFLDMVNTDGKA